MRNSKKKNNTFKRVAAGALSMALVAGALPANVGGFLTGGNGIVAHAATVYESGSVDQASLTVGDKVRAGVKITGEFYYNGNYSSDVTLTESVYCTDVDTQHHISMVCSIKPVNESDFTVEDALFTGEEVSPTIISNYNYTTSGTTKATNIGCYNITLNVDYQAGRGFNAKYYEGTVTKTWNIVKSSPNYAPVLASGLTFNNEAQALVISNGEGAVGGTIHYLYKLNGAESWTAVDSGYPQATAAGTYQVAWYSDASDIYNASGSAENPIVIDETVTIGRQSINPSIVIRVGEQVSNEITYNTDYEIGLADGTNPGGGNVTWKYAPKTGESMPGDDDNSWTDEKPKAAGTYWVKATVAENANYAGATASAVLTINKASIIVNPLPQIAQELEYNEDELPLVNASSAGVTPDNFKIKYLVTAENADAPAANAEGWSTEIPKKTAAGKYKVWYKVDGNDNYNSIAPASLGTVEIAKAKDTILTHPQFNGDATDATKVYYYQDGQDINIVFNQPNGANGQIEYAWKPADAGAEWTPNWDTNTPKRSAVGTYTLLYRSKGDGVNYDPSEVCSATIEVQGITTNEQINKFNAGETEILRLDSDINGNVQIKRNGGIIDLNGHKITGCLVLQNQSNPIIVMNGTLGAGNDAVDDGGGYQPQWKGNVILSDVTCNKRVWSGNRAFYTLGSTSIPDWRTENGGSRVNSAGLLINFEDLHPEDDLNVKLSNQVRKAIKSIQVGDNDPVDYSGANDPDPVLFYQSGQTVKIISGARLNLTYNTTNASYKATESITDDGYVYTFTVPTDNSVTGITAQRLYEYQIESVGDDKLIGKDLNVIPEQAKHTIASLKADDHEYLQKFDNNVEMTISEDFELKTESGYQYYSLDVNGNETQLDAQPSAVGSYRVKAGITVPANSQTYWMIKDVNITRRNYTNHSGDNAKQDVDEMKATVTVGDGTNTYSAYNGAAQTPHISITDTNYKGRSSLVRGTDYEVYMKADNEYVLVEDDTVLAQTNVGNYTFYVKFIGNYTSNNEYESFTWNIVPANINSEGLAPTANTLTYNTAAQTLVTAGASASDYGTTYYKLVGVEGAEWSTTIPSGINAGTYKVAWYIDGNSNYNDLGNEDNPAGTVIVTINPKAVENPRIELNGQPFVYDGTAKTYDAESISVYDGEVLIDPSEYAVGYENNINAGNDTAYVTVSDNKENGNYAISSKNKYFIIQKATPNVTIALASTNGIIYDGAEVETVYGSAVEGKDFTVNDTNPETDSYSVKYYADNNGVMGEELESAPKNVGTYWAVVTLEETANYKSVTDQIKFNIQQKNIECVTIEAGFPTADTDAVTPTGKEPTSLTVKDGETVLTDADFTAEFSDNMYSTNTAKITITGKGNYTGTKEGNYSVLTTLDISAVKDLITKIVDINNNIISADGLSDAFVTKVGNNFKVYSKGKLQFSNLTAQPAQHLDDNGYFYTFNIPEGVNKCTVTHEYSYRTQQTPTDSIDNNGDVKITGYDSNVKSTENVYLDIVKVHFDPVYYLDNPVEKVTVQDVDNPAPGTRYEVISKKFYDNTGKEIDVSKPLNVGTYKVELKIRVLYGNANQDVYVKRNFQVQARSSENVTVSIAENRFVYDGTAKTAAITVTDSGRAANAPMVRGTDYEFGYYNNGTWTVYNDDNFLTNTAVGNYSVIVKFKGNYSGEKNVSWFITNATLPLLDIVPDEDLVYNHKAHQVKVLPKNEGDVIPEGSVLIKYGDATATADQWDTLDVDAPINAGKYKAFIKLNDTVSYAFATNQITSIDFEVQKKDIDSTDITFEYPQFSILYPDTYVTCNPITAKDGENVLTQDTDFKVTTYSTNKPIKNFPVLINGLGNYTGCTYLFWDVIAKPTVTLAETGVKDAANKKIWIKVNTTTDNADAIAKTGVLIYKLNAEKKATDVNPDNMTIENMATLGLVQGSKPGTTYSPSVSNGDYGFVLRSYTELSDGSYVYGDLVETSYAKVISDATTASVELSDVGVKDAASKKIWIKVNTTTDNADAIAKTGVLIYKLDANKTADDVNAENMKIENKVDLGLAQGSKPGTTYSPSVSNGDYGFVMRSYTEMVDGTIVYGDLVETSYAEVARESVSVKISETGVKDAASKKIWIKVNTTTDDENIIAKTGVLIYKLNANKTADVVNAANMTIENMATLGLVQGSKAGTTYSPSVSNGDYGFVLRSYTVLSDGSYVYGDLITTSFSEVAGQN